MNNGATDTAANINTNTGTYSRDSGNYTSTGDSSLPKKNDVRSSSSAYPDGRGAKKAGDSSRQVNHFRTFLHYCIWRYKYRLFVSASS
jgi:hypothetical protein